MERDFDIEVPERINAYGKVQNNIIFLWAHDTREEEAHGTECLLSPQEVLSSFTDEKTEDHRSKITRPKLIS